MLKKLIEKGQKLFIVTHKAGVKNIDELGKKIRAIIVLLRRLTGVRTNVSLEHWRSYFVN